MQKEEKKHRKHKSQPGPIEQSEQKSQRDDGAIVHEEEVPLIVEQAEEEAPSFEQQKAEEYLDQLRRTQADFINYRRRIAREQAEVRSVVQTDLLSQLLPVLDDLELALRAAPKDMSSHPWVQGLFLVAQRLHTQLEQLGVQPIGNPGETFDPRLHEAIAIDAQTDIPEGKIVHVIKPGYALGERVIRPAQVVVAGHK